MARTLVVALVLGVAFTGAMVCGCTTAGGQNCANGWYDLNVSIPVAPDGGVSDALISYEACRAACDASTLDAPVSCSLANANTPSAVISCEAWGPVCLD